MARREIRSPPDLHECCSKLCETNPPAISEWTQRQIIVDGEIGRTVVEVDCLFEHFDILWSHPKIRWLRTSGSLVQVLLKKLADLLQVLWGLKRGAAMACAMEYRQLHWHAGFRQRIA